MVANALGTQAALAAQTLLPEPMITVDKNTERVRSREGGNKTREKQGNYKELMQPSDDCDQSVDRSHMPHSVPVAGPLTKPEISKSRYVSSHCHATHT